jgi:hypothetical protein
MWIQAEGSVSVDRGQCLEEDVHLCGTVPFDGQPSSEKGDTNSGGKLTRIEILYSLSERCPPVLIQR